MPVLLVPDRELSWADDSFGSTANPGCALLRQAVKWQPDAVLGRRAQTQSAQADFAADETMPMLQVNSMPQ